MSADVNTNAVATESKRRPGRRALQSGFSLLARAEPQIWFTGGMLAVCLAMIASLIGLILASGCPRSGHSRSTCWFCATVR